MNTTMADIFETCEIINQYIEESKDDKKLDQNLIDTTYNKLLSYIKDAAEALVTSRRFKKDNNPMAEMASQTYKSKINTVRREYVKLNGHTGVFPLCDSFVRRYLKEHPSLTESKPSANELINSANKDIQSKILTMKGDLEKNKQKYSKESTDARLNVYEAFEAGLITEFEKTELLNILDNIYEE